MSRLGESPVGVMNVLNGQSREIAGVDIIANPHTHGEIEIEMLPQSMGIAIGPELTGVGIRRANSCFRKRNPGAFEMGEIIPGSNVKSGDVALHTGGTPGVITIREQLSVTAENSIRELSQVNVVKGTGYPQHHRDESVGVQLGIANISKLGTATQLKSPAGWFLTAASCLAQGSIG